MANGKRVLITGGSGMIGRRLTTLLLDRGYVVSHIGRTKKRGEIMSFAWNPDKGEMDLEALEATDAIIHLAGAGIADKRWNKKRKLEILESRTRTARLLAASLRKAGHRVGVFISASGISYYGLADAPLRGFVESDTPANDFMAGVTVAWERAGEEINGQAIRKVWLRTGLVLDATGGALAKLALPVKFLVGAPLGTGKQYANWIHIDDLCGIYIKALEDEAMRGAYNAVAPNPVTNAALTRAIAKVLRRPLWLPPVPALAVRLIAGEVAGLVLKGGKISSAKVEAAGYDFKFRTVEAALADLLNPNRNHKIS